MPHFLAISFNPAVSGETRGSWERRVEDALAGYVVPTHLLSSGSGSLRLRFSQDCPISSNEALVLGSVEPIVGRREPVDDLWRRLRDNPEDATRVRTPFGAVFFQDQTLHGVVDPLGLQHLYWCQGEVCAALSTTSVALARLFGKRPSADAFWSLSRVGHLLGTDSLFDGVQKIGAGTRVELREGRGVVLPQPERTAAVASGRSFFEAMEVGAQIVTQTIDSFLEVVPAAGVELSGGLDSRLILAAIGEGRLAGRDALTLGYHGDADIDVARVLAGKYGLRQQIVWLEELDRLTDDEISPLLRRSAALCDYGANVFARAILTWVNEQVGDAPRFSGQNGEFIRGFYYPGQRDSEHYDAQTIASLCRWRIFTNQSIDTRVISIDRRVDLDRGLMQRLVSSFPPGAASWLRATDEFYLCPRMERWVGAGFSTESPSRLILAPFFDHRFLAWARTLDPEWKRRDRSSAAVIAKLSPSLAALELAGGRRPAELAAAGLVSRLRSGEQFARKVASNLSRRLHSGTKPPVGSGRLCQRLQDTGSAERLLSRVRDLDWISESGLLAVVGERSPNHWATLGYLLTLEWALEALDDRGLSHR